MRKRSAIKPAEEPERKIVTESLVWEGVTVEVRYEPDWLNSSELGRDYAHAHLELQVLSPEGAPLPVTETGFRSHFLPCGIVEKSGGPAAFAKAWLDEEAKAPQWRRAEAKWRQLDLFA